MTTLQDARLELAREENIQLASGHAPRHKVSVMGFFSMGFDIEDRQSVSTVFSRLNLMYSRFIFKNELSRTKGKKTSKQLADLEEKRSSLIRHIQLWRPVQLAYTPHVATLLPFVHEVDEFTNQYANPESVPLFFPSSLPSSIRALPEIEEIRNAERRLREPQADDALAEIRRLRRIITGLWLFKKMNVSGTGNRPNTRMLDMYNQLNTKLQRAAHRYRTSYTALLALDPTGLWKERLHELKPGDIRGPGRDPDNPEDSKSSKGRFEPSWIWLVPRSPSERGDDQSEDEFNDTMRVEWAQMRARKCRWNEELLIIQEEMRRVLSYFEWRADWWLEQENRRKSADLSLLSGVSAYAHKQATLCRRMAARCASFWLPTMKKHNIIPNWSEEYKTEPPMATGGEPKSGSDDDDDDELDEWDDRSDTGDLNIDDIVEFD